MIIELFGLPGAGKTTIAAGLSERLPAESVDVEGRRDLIWFNLLALLRRPLAYARRTARAFHEPGSRRLQYYKLRYIFLYRNALVPLTEEQMLDELRRLELPDIALHHSALLESVGEAGLEA